MELPLEACAVLGKALLHVPFLETRVALRSGNGSRTISRNSPTSRSPWIGSRCSFFGKAHGEPIIRLGIPLASVNPVAFDEMARHEPNQIGQICLLSAP